MGKPLLLLLLLLPVLSRLSFLQALTCHQCRHVSARGACESGAGFCETRGRQRCFLRKVYEASTVLYGQQGCSSLCAPTKLINRHMAVDYKCCKDSDLCNRV